MPKFKLHTLALAMMAALLTIASCSDSKKGQSQAAATLEQSFNIDITTFTVEGETAPWITGEANAYTVWRDSLRNDSSMMVHVKVFLRLDSAFNADSVLTKPQLDIMDGKGMKLAVFEIADTAALTHMMKFMQRTPGNRLEVEFVGIATPQQFTALKTAQRMTMRGYSFRQKIEELLPDPAIDALLDEGEKRDAASDRAKRRPQSDEFTKNFDAVDNILRQLTSYKIQEKLTPEQLARYEKLNNHHRDVLNYLQYAESTGD